MNTFDFSPLFRSTIGFDRLSRLMESALNVEDSGYPPYNIEKTGADSYRIAMAVAGFAPDDITITAQENALVVAGKQKGNGDPSRYLYRGIAGRSFERRFQLADFIKVTGADLTNGVLNIELVREVPEAMKPRTIKIESRAAAAPAIETRAA
ncbi:MAG: Hsp20 family protein [Alphaproteobacteria bacterium]|nr:Hsp20 family protein [Alphaproteobacteria bacterium]